MFPRFFKFFESFDYGWILSEITYQTFNWYLSHPLITDITVYEIDFPHEGEYLLSINSKDLNNYSIQSYKSNFKLNDDDHHYLVTIKLGFTSIQSLSDGCL
jgi:hypothetical protein